jgi:hypothetical protein
MLARRRTRIALGFVSPIVVCCCAVACGGETQGPARGPGSLSRWENPTPVLWSVSPPSLVVGQSLTVLGQGFIAEDRGRLTGRLRGAFFDDKGGVSKVDLAIRPTRVGAGKLQWHLWPDVVFHPDGNRLGRFVGSLEVRNHGFDGSLRRSAALPFAVTIGPSIIARVMRPSGAGCALITSDTLEDEPLELAVEVVGLRAPTPQAPIELSWSFPTHTWKVELHESPFPTGKPDPSPQSPATVLSQQLTTGSTATLSHGVPFVAHVGGKLVGQRKLKGLRTGKIPAEGKRLKATVGVAAVDAAGRWVSLAMPITVHRMAELEYNGATKVAERFGALPVSGCIPGGDIGRNVSYQESTREVRERSLTFNWFSKNAVETHPLAWFSQAMDRAIRLEFSAEFGVRVDGAVSSSKSAGTELSGRIIPGHFGVFYRQTVKLYRIGRLVGYNACGAGIPLGEAIVTDWIFNTDLATGTKCMPPTKLPPAQKLLP